LAIVLMVLTVAGVGLVSRYGVLTPQGRLLIEARTSGLKLGRIGRLKIEGLSGDIWDKFGVRRLTIADEKGVWLEAHNLTMDWRPAELFRRRLHADTITAQDVKILRRPTLTAKSKSQGLPVSFDVDAMRARLETLPEASVRRGFFDLSGEFEVERAGGASGAITAASLIHKGDGLKAVFDVGKTNEIKVIVDASEAEGGALAGALGLAADKPFVFAARAQGTTSAGSASLRATTGTFTPLDGSGSWNAQGGSGKAHVVLAASSLLTSNVRRFGPEVDLALTMKRRPKGDFDADLKARSENMTLTARGPVDVAKRAVPAGLAVDVAVVDLKRMTAFPRMDGGRFTGRLTGDLDNWQAKGQASASNLALASYTLARAEGPASVAWRNKELHIEADAVGSGGTGTGLFAALMGAAPRASASIDRIAGRGYLIRSLSGKGSGFEIKGSGSRGLLGQLNFGGEVTLSNFAPIRAGASGVLRGGWTAKQAKRGIPWTIDIDGRAADFRSSLGQLDRLLGERPKIAATVLYGGDDWNVSSARVDGDKAWMTGKGVLSETGDLKFDLDWQAQGPFSAGPVEIAGRADGTGALLGSLARPKMTLDAQIDTLALPQLTLQPARVAVSFEKAPQGTDGAIRVTGASEHGPAQAQATFSFRNDGVDLAGIDARAAGLTAQGSLSLRSGSPSRADLTLAAGPGAFVTSGRANARVRIVDAPGGAQGSIRLEASGLKLVGSEAVFRVVDLTAEGPMSALPYQVRADIDLPQAPIRLEGRGTASETGNTYAVDFQGGGKIRNTDVRTLAPLRVTFGGQQQTATGALGVGGGRIDVRASQGGEQVAIDARLDGVDLSVLNPDLAGKITAVLAASGRGSSLSGSLDARLAGARSRDGPAELAIDGSVAAQLSGQRLMVDVNASSAQGLRSTANFVLPAESSAAPFRVAVNRTRPVTGKFDIDGELQPIWDLFFGGARTIGGRLTAQGTVAGTINDPSLTGQATLANGRLEDAATGLKLTGVSAAADLNRERVTVSRFAGVDGRGGTVTGEGTVSLERGGSSTFTLRANRFLLVDNDLAEAQASGDVTVTRGADGKARLVGKLTIDRADIVAEPPTPSGVVAMAVIERNRPPGRGLPVQSTSIRGPEIALDVTLTAPRRVFVEGRGLSAELSLDARVTGTTARPVLDGVARIVRGEYDFAGKRFEFDDDGVVYLASSADRIRLNLRAVREDPSLTAVVRVTGTAAKPEIVLTSNPVLPNDEVLSQVLFGRSASQLSPIEAAQLAAAVASLATGGGFDIIGGLRSFAGLDRLAFAGGDASGVAVSGGKYLTDDVYLELTGGGRQAGAAQVEWRVRRNLSIVSRLGGDGDNRLSVRWRRDYGGTATAPTGK